MTLLPCSCWPLAEHAKFGQNGFDASLGSVFVCINDSMPMDACFFKPPCSFHRLVESYLVNPNSPIFLNLLLLALAGALGCLIGSMVAYGIGSAGGRPLMLKYGKYVLISQHDADKADHFFQRWGAPTAFFSRLLPVVRTYISLPAGMANMRFSRFCVYT